MTVILCFSSRDVIIENHLDILGRFNDCSGGIVTWRGRLQNTKQVSEKLGQVEIILYIFLLIVIN